MKSKLILAMAISLIAYPYILTHGKAANGVAVGSTGYGQNASPFSSDELDNLLAPIALYPDPLLAQVLPAATFVDDIAQAAAWLRANNDTAQIDNQPWDVSVKAIAHFPDVLYQMNDHLDWTTALGQAFVDQSTDVSDSIQRLRTQAANAGTLVSTPQQTVSSDQGYVTIEPAQPTVIYVPQYDPAVVFAPSNGAIIASSLIGFGTGLAIGAWLNRGWNWGGGGIYYHGWAGGGWVGRSRPFVNYGNRAYVNNNFNRINTNRNVLNRNVNAANLNRFNSVHRNTNWGSVDRANMTRHARTSPGNLPGRAGAPGALPAGKGAPGGRPGTAGGRPGTLPASGASPMSTGGRGGFNNPGGGRTFGTPSMGSATNGRASSLGGGGRARSGSGGGGRGHGGMGGGGRARGGGRRH